jgi:glycerol kinase
MGQSVTELRIDGGGAGDLVCELVAGQLGRSVERPVNRETTAFGAAALAGLAVGVWSGVEEVAALRRVERRFEPSDDGTRDSRYRRWQRAVDRARGWAVAD